MFTDQVNEENEVPGPTEARLGLELGLPRPPGRGQHPSLLSPALPLPPPHPHTHPHKLLSWLCALRRYETDQGQILDRFCGSVSSSVKWRGDWEGIMISF